MHGKRGKIIVGVLLIVIALPMALMVTAVAWFAVMDKTNGTIVSSGETRHYLLYVPKTYDPSRATPLVISMHGAAAWPAQQMELSRWNEVADERGFIVVYPSATGILGILPRSLKVWRGRSDATFLADLIDTLGTEYNIDPTRIYADGFSNGGGMAFAVSCRLSHRVAAVGAVGPAILLPWDRCVDSRPVPMVAFHGTDDGHAPYNGGPSWPHPRPFASVSTWTANWARRNQCRGDPVEARITASVRRLAYTDCAEDAEVMVYTVEGGGHTWPGGKPMPEWFVGPTTREIDATRVMWEFFVRHPRGTK